MWHSKVAGIGGWWALGPGYLSPKTLWSTVPLGKREWARDGQRVRGGKRSRRKKNSVASRSKKQAAEKEDRKWRTWMQVKQPEKVWEWKVAGLRKSFFFFCNPLSFPLIILSSLYLFSITPQIAPRSCIMWNHNNNHNASTVINIPPYILPQRRRERHWEWFASSEGSSHYYIPTSSNINAHWAQYSNMSSSEMALSGWIANKID